MCQFTELEFGSKTRTATCTHSNITGEVGPKLAPGPGIARLSSGLPRIPTHSQGLKSRLLSASLGCVVPGGQGRLEVAACPWHGQPAPLEPQQLAAVVSSARERAWNRMRPCTPGSHSVMQHEQS